MIDRYKDEQINEIWENCGRTALMCNISITYFNHITGNKVSSFDLLKAEPRFLDQIGEIEAQTNHDVNALVLWLEHQLQKNNIPDSRFIHFGLTSSDLLDSCLSLQIGITNKILRGYIADLQKSITDKIIEPLSATSIIGRTHGQWAELLDPRIKYNQFIRLLDANLPCGIAYGKLSGSLGDNKYCSEEVEEKVLGELNLVPDMVQGQIISRSYFCKMHHQWVIIASLLEKFITDLRLLMLPEVGEFKLIQSESTNGSSSMPHKLNPIPLETMTGLIKLIQAHHVVITDIINTWHERDIVNSSVERIVWPMDANLMGYVLTRLTKVVNNISIDFDKIAHHIQIAGKKLDSQRAMLSFIQVDGASREDAYNRVKKVTRDT